jgi:Spy/CpxP family protein refolding chaperone
MNQVGVTIVLCEEKMSQSPLRRLFVMLLGAMALIFAVSVSERVRAQETDQQPADVQSPSDDPIPQLNLSADQQQKIRAITKQNREERARLNRQLRDAQLALEDTLDSDSPSEAAVEQRIRDVTNAQAAHLRMRAMTELKIRSVLTPDQLRIWREIRAQRTRRQLNPDGGRRDVQRNLPNQRNGIAPLFPNNRRNQAPVQPKP